LPQRFFYHPFVFRNRIWFVGGADANREYADVWSSSDGLNWSQRKNQLPFGPRSRSQVVHIGDWLYLLNHDVWRSRDALNWELVSPSIVPGQRIFGYTAIAFRDQIWLLGCNRNGEFSSQVLVSKDGRQWQSHLAPWKPRGGVAAAVHQGRLYITGGKYGGTPNHPEFRYDNDLWVLE
jgi:hypothetical protein